MVNVRYVFNKIKYFFLGESKFKEEYQLHKEAYGIALQTYCTNFDLHVNVNPISDAKYEAIVKFRSIKNMVPIKVFINRRERKILGVVNILLSLN